jgi:hypothetical protein
VVGADTVDQHPFDFILARAVYHKQLFIAHGANSGDIVMPGVVVAYGDNMCSGASDRLSRLSRLSNRVGIGVTEHGAISPAETKASVPKILNVSQ